MTEHDRVHRETRLLAERRDRRVKLGLLGVSLACIAFLAAAALQENVFPDWRRHQQEYAGILQDKATDDWGRKIAADFRVEMRQVVLPELGTIDRCVTCHTGIDDPRMTDVPNPYAVHPGKYLEWHDPARFGCTICHRGQGRAMTFEEAKAEGHHWDWPLLPKNLVQSSCGQCHAMEEVASHGGEVYARGAALFEAKGCRSCHALGGRGGALGPALDGEGSKLAGQLPMAAVRGPRTLAQWLVEHFEDPQRIVAGSRMPRPGLSRPETEALTTYMLSLQGRDLPESYLSPERHREIYAAAHPPERTGAQLWSMLCSSCHDTGSHGRWDKFFATFVPAVRGDTYVQHAEPAYVAAQIRLGRQGTIMPAWGRGAGGLTEDEILKLVAFVLGRDDLTLADTAPRSPEWTAAERRLADGDAAHGGVLFAKNCSGCHGVQGQGKLGPSLVSPAFQGEASHDFLFTTIALGRADTAMPSFLTRNGLGERDVRDLVAFVRTLGAAPATPVATAAEKGGEHATH
jgi:mono/diheme cytochrome c family protein